jgi:hypothetical protein
MSIFYVEDLTGMTEFCLAIMLDLKQIIQLTLILKLLILNAGLDNCAYFRDTFRLPNNAKLKRYF